MTLWFVFALMTAAAVFAVLWPLGRGNTSAREGSEVVVYKDQLAEVQRDAAAGMIGEKEAEAARVEISRRLLAASDADAGTPASSSLSFRRAVAVIALAGLPLMAVALYAQFGLAFARRLPACGAQPCRSRNRVDGQAGGAG